MLCWVFVRVSFLQNYEENLDVYRLPQVVCNPFEKMFDTTHADSCGILWLLDISMVVKVFTGILTLVYLLFCCRGGLLTTIISIYTKIYIDSTATCKYNKINFYAEIQRTLM